VTTTTKTTTSKSVSAAPAPATPSLLPVIPGAIASAVPDFFINTYRIPPFLLGVYQAAGMEYDVPWQVLAAINEIETDYGSNQSVSSAGAIGWMQFMPATWRLYGVDATGNGKRDPYNPVDAIFAAARYLDAAGAARDLKGAIFAYNHASWYVQSVLLRAKLIAGLPDALVNGLTSLSQGHFPVLGAAHYSATGGTSQPQATSIAGRRDARVVAAQDGVISKLGDSPALGHFVVLTDDNGNQYTYAHLGGVAARYPWPKSSAYKPASASEATLPSGDRAPTVAATAGGHAVGGAPASSALGSPVVTPPRVRLFANPLRPAAYAAGGRLQAQTGQSIPAGQGLDRYLADNFGLRPSQVELRALHQGVRVLAGTVLGRLGSSGLRFAIRPAGTGSPPIDPRPILDGWKLAAASAIYSAPGPGSALSSHSSVGQILLAGKERLVQTLLSDPRIHLNGCARQDIAAGVVNRHLLAALEFLAASGVSPTVGGLACNPAVGSGEVDALDLTALNGTSVLGHQGSGSITDGTLRRLLLLQGTMKPTQIVSLMKFPGAGNAVALPGYADRVHLSFGGPAAVSASIPAPKDVLARNSAFTSTLAPEQWQRLMSRLEQLAEPRVLDHPSGAAIADVPGSTG